MIAITVEGRHQLAAPGEPRLPPPLRHVSLGRCAEACGAPGEPRLPPPLRRFQPG